MDKAKIYLVSSDKNWSEPYFLRKIKDLHVGEGLDTVFASDFETIPTVQTYCSRYDILTKEIDNPDAEKNYYQILDYARKNLDKNNLAYLIKEEEVEEFHNLFKKNIFFNTFIL